MTSDESLLASLVITSTVILFVTLLFLVLRVIMKSSYVLHPFAPVESGLLGWIQVIIMCKWKQFFRTHGLDSLIYLRFLAALCKLAVLTMIFGLVVTVPVNYTGSRKNLPTGNPYHVSGTAVISIANIDPDTSDGNRLWAIVASVYFNSIISYYFFSEVYSTYHKYRLRLKARRSPENLTVRIKNIPMGISEAQIKEKLYQIFPGKVLAVHRVPYIPNLIEIQDMKRKWELRRSRAITEYQDKENIHCCYSWDDGLNTVSYLNHSIGIIEQKISEAQKNAMFEWTHVAYVSFTDPFTAKLCAQSVLDKNPFLWLTSFAPEPRNILWSNHGKSPLQNKIKSYLISIFVFFLIIFWAIPIGFASSIANLKIISTSLGSESLSEFVTYHPHKLVWIEGLLPAFVIWLFYLMLMPLLRFLSSNQGFLSYSKVEKHTLRKLFIFLFMNVFLASLLAGTAIDVLDRLVFFANNPPQLLPLIASIVPNQVNYFISYVLLNTILIYSIELLRPHLVILRLIKLKCCSVAPEEINEAKSPDQFDYPYFYGLHQLFFLITITYSSIAPLMLPFGIIYFGATYFVHMHNMLFVNKQNYEGFGDLWPAVFSQVCFVLGMYQIIIMVVLSITGFYYSFVIFPLLLVTATYWYNTRKHFLGVTEYGPLDFEFQGDKQDEWTEDKLKTAYIHPGLVPTKSPHPSYKILEEDTSMENEIITLNSI